MLEDRGGRGALALREAAPGDADSLVRLLAECHMERESILAPGTRYWVAEDGADLPAGVVGLEFAPGVALLRSAAVRPDLRGRGLGGRLVEAAIAAARAGGARRVYLFSTGAGAYWRRHGFVETPVAELVGLLPDSYQVRRYEELGWLPDEVAWRLDLDA